MKLEETGFPEIIPKNPLFFRLVLLITIVGGLLQNTAIINTDSFGIPIFYGVIPILLLVVLYTLLSGSLLLNERVFTFGFFMVFGLLMAMSVHILFEVNDTWIEIKQFVARFNLVLFCLLTYLFIWVRHLYASAFIYTKNSLKMVILYGIYQFIGNIYGWPLFLDFLRNNVSFGLEKLHLYGGWLTSIRAYSIWTEPSFSAMPIGLFIYCLIYHSKSREKFVWGFLVLVYSVLTFSRVVWGVVIVMAMVSVGIIAFKKFKMMRVLDGIKSFMVILAILALSLSLTFVVPILMDDLSAVKRSSTIVIGFRIFLDNLWFGSGMNSYPLLEKNYSYGLYNPEEILVQNLFVGFAQQMGLLGIFLSLLPIFTILSFKNISLEKRLFLITPSVFVGSLGGDFYYMPFFWLIFAMAAAENSLFSAAAEGEDPSEISKSRKWALILGSELQ